MEMIKGAIVILNSGGLPMTVTDSYQDEKGCIMYECTWIAPSGQPYQLNLPAECVHLASEDPIFLAQKRIQEDALQQQQRQMEYSKSQQLGLVKAMHKTTPHA